MGKKESYRRGAVATAASHKLPPLQQQQNRPPADELGLSADSCSSGLQHQVPDAELQHQQKVSTGLHEEAQQQQQPEQQQQQQQQHSRQQQQQTATTERTCEDAALSLLKATFELHRAGPHTQGLLLPQAGADVPLLHLLRLQEAILRELVHLRQQQQQQEQQHQEQQRQLQQEQPQVKIPFAGHSRHSSIKSLFSLPATFCRGSGSKEELPAAAAKAAAPSHVVATSTTSSLHAASLQRSSSCSSNGRSNSSRNSSSCSKGCNDAITSAFFESPLPEVVLIGDTLAVSRRAHRDSQRLAALLDCKGVPYLFIDTNAAAAQALGTHDLLLLDRLRQQQRLLTLEAAGGPPSEAAGPGGPWGKPGGPSRGRRKASKRASAAAATSAAAGPVPPQLLIDGAPLGTAAEVLELEEEGFLGGQLFVLGAST
ncbi:hypothetical protein, conserved [Eimeria tenella]|uniref:Uncharacterized protein n=1 Tax=Eimeria tenella TaxID=5802 RepID=U6L1R6_EIMTE|nr:hypothetical protein, conserved [Eimeria tenella]CDJ44121.1 hypothetical protein, conserved [Eimeria tenella]|eukprot:XP_013234870.1 hypothetical protein, conserved [Eimeria tenella]